MTKQEFNQKYASKGGIDTLNYLVKELYTNQYIAEHFGVTKEAVRQWLKELYGVEQVSRRVQRQEKVISGMLEFAKTHSLEEFREAYSFISNHYYEIALQEAISRKIYELQ